MISHFIEMVSVAPGGRFVNIPFDDGLMEVYEAEREFNAANVTCSAFNYKVGCRDGTITDNNSPLPDYAMDIYSEPVCLHLTEAGHIVVGTKSGRVLVYDTELPAHPNQIRSISSCGEMLLTTSMTISYLHDLSGKNLEMFVGGFHSAVSGTSVAIAELDLVHLFVPKRPPIDIQLHESLGVVRRIGFQCNDLMIVCANGFAIYSDSKPLDVSLINKEITDAYPVSSAMFYFDRDG